MIGSARIEMSLSAMVASSKTPARPILAAADITAHGQAIARTGAFGPSLAEMVRAAKQCTVRYS